MDLDCRKKYTFSSLLTKSEWPYMMPSTQGPPAPPVGYIPLNASSDEVSDCSDQEIYLDTSDTESLSENASSSQPQASTLERSCEWALEWRIPVAWMLEICAPMVAGMVVSGGNPVLMGAVPCAYWLLRCTLYICEQRQYFRNDVPRAINLIGNQ